MAGPSVGAELGPVMLQMLVGYRAPRARLSFQQMMCPPEPLSANSDLSELKRRGYVVLRSIVSASQIAQLRAELSALVLRHPTVRGAADSASHTILRRRETVFAVRGLLDLWPGALNAAVGSTRVRALVEEAVRNPAAGKQGQVGVVRSMMFDKPPGANWFVPRHRDETIAVDPCSAMPPGFKNPTRKHGVSHLQAPTSLLASMLTARLHLDDAVLENGALQVVAGSHEAPLELERNVDETLVEVKAGDVVMMRPLLLHSSRSTESGGSRRVVHLELAREDVLPHPLRWHRFWPLS